MSNMFTIQSPTGDVMCVTKERRENSATYKKWKLLATHSKAPPPNSIWDAKKKKWVVDKDKIARDEEEARWAAMTPLEMAEALREEMRLMIEQIRQ